jgi:ribonuclease E
MDTPVTDVAAVNTDAPTENDAATGEDGQPRERRERRSRDRYGRDRRERREPRADEAMTEANTDAPVVEAAAADDMPVRSYFSKPSPQPAPVATPSEEPPMAPAAQAAAPAQAAPVQQGMPKVGRYELPMAEMSAIASASGLEWVNSDSAKVAQAQAAIAAEPRPVHVPREPKPVVVLDDGPLVLVETRKDLRQVTLAFETPAQ